ncbi:MULTISPECIES: DUF1491 family protein [unclassified Sphingomonas]|uniref:DUF1491 family protein n=1 Tax=unclassified Sphingomonas TaxID=196159 RepID=UPI00092AB6E1|nr:MULTISPECIES: DUF1491 family protein [unclassified Sphingomonas]MBN8849390.1 DUF1491 family protein [Sphingomonas sp.]MBS0285183.1 DUF1491 family protein [Pseudomonadota bacterium]OJV33342.1 MAG: hypothetical protein BGO24_08485 [Sphingomonas sp. 67-36]
MSGRLPAHVTVDALLRRVNDAGGIAVVRARGDRQAGAILVIDEREAVVLERGIGPDGGVALIETGPAAGRGESLDDYWQRRRQRDPDLWVVALDIPQAKRFAAETICDD